MSAITDNNVKFLQQEFSKSSRFYMFEELDVIQDIVSKIDALQSYKITSFAGGGSFALTFILSNDHALKLYFGGVQDDAKTYDSYNAVAFSSKGVQSLPMIYARGSVPVKITPRNKTTLSYLSNNGELHWVEMNRIVPFDKWMGFTRKASGREIADALDHFWNMTNALENLNKLYNVRKLTDIKRIAKKEYFVPPAERGTPEFTKQLVATQNAQEFQMHYQIVFQNRADQSDKVARLLTEKEITAIMNMIFQMVKRGHHIYDFHAGNFGILPQSDPSDPVFVMYDN